MKKVKDFFQRNAFTLGMVAVAFAIAAILASFLVIRSIDRLRVIAKNRLIIQEEFVASKATERYSSGVTTLHALEGFLASEGELARDKFYTFIKTSHFFQEHPGFSSFAYIERVLNKDKKDFINRVRLDTSVRKEGYPSFAITPEETRDEYWPIVYVYPEEELGFLLGNDQLAETTRAENIARARDLGDESLFTLVSLGQGGEGGIIAMPLYSSGFVPNSPEDKQRLFRGAVTTALVINDFFIDILPTSRLDQQSISVFITGRGKSMVPLFKSGLHRDFLDKIFGDVEATSVVELNSNKVSLIFRAPAHGLLSDNEANEPLLLALIFLASALFMTFVIITSQRIRQFNDLKKKYGFVSMLSHQLRTPITKLRWRFEGQENVPEEEKENHRMAVNSILELNSIIDRMLTYIEITQSKEKLPKNDIVSIDDVCQGAFKLLSYSYDTKRIKGDDFGKNLFIKANKEKLSAAFSYVIENALVYSPKNTDVFMEVNANNNTVEIRVKDNGYGVPANQQSLMFTEFFRTENASLGKNYGSGVSLAIAKQIIENHGGSIRFTSEEEKGSIFVISLPLAKQKKSG